MIMSPKEPPAKKQKTDATATEGLDVLQAAAEVGVGVTDASAIATAAAVASAVAETNVVPRRSDGKKVCGPYLCILSLLKRHLMHHFLAVCGEGVAC